MPGGSLATLSPSSPTLSSSPAPSPAPPLPQPRPQRPAPSVAPAASLMHRVGKRSSEKKRFRHRLSSLRLPEPLKESQLLFSGNSHQLNSFKRVLQKHISCFQKPMMFFSFLPFPLFLYFQYFSSFSFKEILVSSILILNKIKRVQLLEENIGVNFFNLGLSNGFLDETPKTQVTKEKNRYIGLHQNLKKKKLSANYTIKKVRKQSLEWEQIFSNHMFDKELVYRTYKEFPATL